MANHICTVIAGEAKDPMQAWASTGAASDPPRHGENAWQGR